MEVWLLFSVTFNHLACMMFVREKVCLQLLLNEEYNDDLLKLTISAPALQLSSSLLTLEQELLGLYTVHPPPSNCLPRHFQDRNLTKYKYLVHYLASPGQQYEEDQRGNQTGGTRGGLGSSSRPGRSCEVGGTIS